MIGLNAFISGNPRALGARSLDITQVAFLKQEDFKVILKNNPGEYVI